MNKSQVQRIEDALADGKWHCTSQFYADFMADPRARMIDLKKRGYDLEKRPCKSHNYHDGPTKEWRIKTAPTTRYPFKVYIGAKVFEIKDEEEEKKWRDYQTQKAVVGTLQTNN